MSDQLGAGVATFMLTTLLFLAELLFWLLLLGLALCLASFYVIGLLSVCVLRVIFVRV